MRPVYQAEPIQVFAQDRQRKVRCDRKRHGKAELPPVFGHVGNSKLLSSARRRDGNFLPIDFDLAGISRLNSEQSESYVGAARPHKACKTQNFARAQFEIDPGKRSNSTKPANAANDISADARGSMAIILVDITSHHIADKQVARHFGHRSCGYMLAVSKN